MPKLRNPTTGEVIELVDGQWRPVASAAPAAAPTAPPAQPQAQPQAPPAESGGSYLGDVAVGVGKGAGDSVVHAGQVVNLLSKILNPANATIGGQPGISDAIMPGAMDTASNMMRPAVGGESVGYGVEKGVELLGGGMPLIKAGVGAVKAAPGLAVNAARAAGVPGSALLAKILPFVGKGGGSAASAVKPPAGTIANQFAKMQGKQPEAQVLLATATSKAQKAAADLLKAKGRGAVPGHGFAPKKIEEAAARAANEAQYAQTLAQKSRDVRAITEFLDSSGKQAGRAAAKPAKVSGPKPPAGPSTNASTAARTVKQPASSANVVASPKSAPVKSAPAKAPAAKKPAPDPKQAKLTELGRLLMSAGTKRSPAVAKKAGRK